MSPARSKRQPVPHRRSRREIVTAVAVSAGIVIATAVLVWLLRPGPAGIPATGGLMNRQPRASWLIGMAIGAGFVATWFIMRGKGKARARAHIVLPIVLSVLLIAAVVGALLWPGGLLRHDVAPTPAPTTTTPKSTPTTTPKPSTTVAKGGSGSATTSLAPTSSISAPTSSSLAPSPSM